MQKRILITEWKKLTVFGIFICMLIIFWGGGNFFGDYQWEKRTYQRGVENKIVVIDPGHGGADPGAVFQNLKEKDINYQIAQNLKKILTVKDAEVIITREIDQIIIPSSPMSRQEHIDNLLLRKEIAINNRGNIFVSIHVNSNKNNDVRGGIVYYWPNNKYNLLLAEEIQKQINSFYSINNEIKQANFSVIYNNPIPSVLVEVGFITNQADRKILTDYSSLDKLSESVAQGIENYTEKLGN